MIQMLRFLNSNKNGIGLVTLLLLWGTAGALEIEAITVTETFVRGVIIGVFGIAVVNIQKISSWLGIDL